jgi:hypothetical protein
LQPLLTLAASVREVAIPSPDPAAVSANKQRMLATVQARMAQTSARSVVVDHSLFSWLNRRLTFGGIQARPLIRATLVVAIVILVLSLSASGLVISAADSLPGDTLYPVKRMAEDMRLSLTLRSATRAKLQTEFTRERQEEVRSVLEAGRSADVEFQGLLEQMGDDSWIISGLKVTLGNNTGIEGQPLLGATIAVRAASTGDGTLRALHLQVESEPTAMPTPEAADDDKPGPIEQSEPGEQEDRNTAHTPGPEPFATEEIEPTEGPETQGTHDVEPTDQPAPTEVHQPESTHQPDPTEAHEPESTHQPDPTEAHEPEPAQQPGPTETHESEPTHQGEPAATHSVEPGRTPTPEPTDEHQP